ncbi:Protein CBG21954 [Caenorhabditis briggsae]|uniref:Protein CBG21954 n=1 Tax=Caenorhabditis briggsae TaxID=6238 RepID=A8Y153_CAEBR|nr:Protein CBG21954 [Caenorhabditis briggsae]CAP38614.1 Protein CBG21954 [Caenorhabditis briggsae]
MIANYRAACVLSILETIIDDNPDMFLPRGRDSEEPVTLRVFEDGDQQFLMKSEISDALKAKLTLNKRLDTISLEEVLKNFDTKNIELKRFVHNQKGCHRVYGLKCEVCAAETRETQENQKLSILEKELADLKIAHQKILEENQQKSLEIQELQQKNLRLSVKNETNEVKMKQLTDKLANSKLSIDDRNYSTACTSQLKIQCLICEKSIESEKDQIIRCPLCKRRFHSKCAIDWLKEHQQCPACNGDLPKKNASILHSKKRRNKFRHHNQRFDRIRRVSAPRIPELARHKIFKRSSDSYESMSEEISNRAPKVFESLKGEKYIHRIDLYPILENIAVNTIMLPHEQVHKQIVEFIKKGEYRKIDKIFAEIDPIGYNEDDSRYYMNSYRSMPPMLRKEMRDASVIYVQTHIKRALGTLMRERNEFHFFKPFVDPMIDPPTVRLFEDKDEQYVIKSEFFDSINLLLPLIDRILFEEDRDVGIISTISLTDIMEFYGDHAKKIEFIRYPITRPKHKGAYVQGRNRRTFCVLIADAFLECMKFLISHCQIFQKIKDFNVIQIVFDEMEKVFHADFFAVFMHSQKACHMIMGLQCVECNENWHDEFEITRNYKETENPFRKINIKKEKDEREREII